jgi:hypothetical protein
MYLLKTWEDAAGNWHKTSVEAGLSESVTLSDSKSFDLSSSAAFKIGIDTSAALAASFSASAGVSSSFSADASWSMSKNKSLVIASEAGSNVTDEVKFEVQSDPTWSTASNAIVATLAAVGAAAAVGGGIASGIKMAESADDDDAQALHGTLEVMRGLCLTAFAATLAHGLLRENGVTRSRFTMQDESIDMELAPLLMPTEKIARINMSHNSVDLALDKQFQGHNKTEVKIFHDAFQVIIDGAIAFEVNADGIVAPKQAVVGTDLFVDGTSAMVGQMTNKQQAAGDAGLSAKYAATLHKH